jgi:hypothetical protein
VATTLGDTRGLGDKNTDLPRNNAQRPSYLLDDVDSKSLHPYAYLVHTLRPLDHVALWSQQFTARPHTLDQLRFFSAWQVAQPAVFQALT